MNQNYLLFKHETPSLESKQLKQRQSFIVRLSVRAKRLRASATRIKFLWYIDAFIIKTF